MTFLSRSVCSSLPARHTQTGVTLLELLVAMGIFLFLGAALITMLRQGIATWRSGESRREIYESAREILEQISSDLSSTYTVKAKKDQPLDIMFLCDFASSGLEGCYSQRLRFVRTLAGAGSDYASQEAGALLGADSDLDLVTDGREARAGLLRSTSGLCEVAYISDPVSETLYRAMRAPVGGARTLFTDANVQVGDSGTCLIEFARGVMFLGFSFWTQYTNSWDESNLTIVSPGSNQKSGPLLWWDSTRSALTPAVLGAPEKGEYTLYRDASSRTDPSDDVFPREVRITLVLAERGTEGQTTRLRSRVSQDALRIPVEDVLKLPDPARAFPYVKIDTEWVRYSTIEGNSLILDEYGRGRRGTQPASHNRGAPVRAGHTFVITVTIPGFREDWNER